MKTQTIYLDGKILRKFPDFVVKLSPGIMMGDGVFGTMRADKDQIQFFDDHFARLTKGLKVYKIKPPFSGNKLADIILNVVRANKLDRARVRVVVWRENSRIRTAVVAQDTPVCTSKMFNLGYRAVISSFTRNRNSLSHIKSLHYHLFYEALCEARKKNYQEAFLLNNKGILVEGAHSNVFIVKVGRIRTPAVKEGCLKGITRQKALLSARREKIPFSIGSIKKSEIINADEIFITNSIIGIMPVIFVNERQISTGTPGDITKKIRDCYCNLLEDC